MNAHTLMIQGTTSDAGKSTVVAGLCRVLKRRGIHVVPFKPQNMALNSAVTADGGEIGRAQAVQAYAAGLQPTTDMNPVLLKPNSDTGAQVIIHGHAVANMKAIAYHDYKKVAMQAVLASHQRLKEKFEVIMVEGAGSPAEINLRANDIANMGFAEAVDCPVILVADIDRGGVFAHLVGTLAVLSDSEQARIQGFIINRFRGDIALLQGGLDWLEARTGKPVLGVLPYLHGLHLEAEDALSSSSPLPCRERARERVENTEPPPMKDPHPNLPPEMGKESMNFNRQSILMEHPQKLRVVVPALPHISNHTDFDPLRLHPQVELIWVKSHELPPAADLVILPGCKNVRADLQHLQAQGWQSYLQKHLRYGGKLMGICGGLQMLGTQIHDPHGIESDSGSSQGFGLLDLQTTLEQDKQLHNVSGCILPGIVPVTGYEIHAGISSGNAMQHPFAQLDDDRLDGAVSTDGQIIATYLHGVFDSTEACAALLQWAGLKNTQLFDYIEYCERNFDRLADTLEAHLDMPRIMQLLGDTA